MKNQLISIMLTFLATFFLCSCGESTQKSTAEEESAESTETVLTSDEADEAGQMNCDLTNFSFSIGGNARDIAITYENEKPVKAVLSVEDQEQIVNYNYNESGQLAGFLSMPDGSVSEYVYDDSGKLLEIKSEFMPASFEYNEQNQIISQTSVYGGKLTYEYNESGLPSVCNTLDKSGELQSTIEIEYDDKKNPFVDKTVMINSVEMIYGYPVANCKNNGIKFITTYHVKTAWKVNGDFKNPGDKDTVSVNYEYNEFGYPVQFIANTDTLNLDYSCK